MTLGQKIQLSRKKQGLSQEDLANTLNISRQAVQKWESDQSTPDIDNLVKLSNIFDVSLDWLIKDINQAVTVDPIKEEISQTTQVVENKKIFNNIQSEGWLVTPKGHEIYASYKLLNGAIYAKGHHFNWGWALLSIPFVSPVGAVAIGAFVPRRWKAIIDITTIKSVEVKNVSFKHKRANIRKSYVLTLKDGSKFIFSPNGFDNWVGFFQQYMKENEVEEFERAVEEKARKEAERLKRVEEAKREYIRKQNERQIKYIEYCNRINEILKDFKKNYYPFDIEKKAEAKRVDSLNELSLIKTLDDEEYIRVCSKFENDLRLLRPFKISKNEYDKLVKGRRKKVLTICVVSCLAFALALTGTIHIAKFVNKNNDYKIALSLMESGDYKEALETLETIPNFRKSNNKYKVCQGLIDLNLAKDNETESYITKGINEIVSGKEIVKIKYLKSVDFRPRVSSNYEEIVSEPNYALKDCENETGYSFVKWGVHSLSYKNSETFLCLVSLYSLNEYVITYNLNGGNLPAGKSNPTSYTFESKTITLNEPEKEGYTFKGWFDENGKEIKQISRGSSGNLNLTAHWHINVYTVNFFNWDNELLYSGKVNYGENAVYPYSVPIKDGDVSKIYKFVGWDKDITNIKSNLDVYAVFEQEVRKYAITWKNYDGTPLLTESVAYGTKPTYNGPIPYKSGNAQYSYTWNGWDKEIVAVNGNETYTAVFLPVLNKYNVVFKNYDGTILSTVKVNYGEFVEFNGETPVKPQTEEYSYYFIGWDIDFNQPILQDTICYAQFDEVKRYSVVFKDFDGSILETYKIDENDLPTYYGDTPIRSDLDGYRYIFSGWDKSINDPITTDTVFCAQYNSYKLIDVNFYNFDGTLLEHCLVPKSFGAQYSGETPTREKDAKYSYEFSGWDGDTSNITEENCSFIAQFSETINKYTVTFKNNNGDLIDSVIVDYGTNIRDIASNINSNFKYMSDAYREEEPRVFKGWENCSMSIVQDLEVTAFYEKAFSFNTSSDFGSGAHWDSETHSSYYVLDCTRSLGRNSIIIPNRAVSGVAYIDLRTVGRLSGNFSEIYLCDGISGISPSAFDKVIKSGDNKGYIYIPDTVKTISGNIFNTDCSNDCIIYCESEEKPENWSDNWNGGCDVVWGVKQTDLHLISFRSL